MQLGVPQPTNDQNAQYQQIKAMLILVFTIMNDVLMKIINFEDPCHTWLQFQNQYEVRDNLKTSFEESFFFIQDFL